MVTLTHTHPYAQPSHAHSTWHQPSHPASHLQAINLRGNRLTGTIGPELFTMLPLSELDLGDNMLTGTIPGALGFLPTLTSVLLDGNDLEGGTTHYAMQWE